MPHPDMSKIDMATLTVVQEVLRGVLTSLVTAGTVDGAKFATGLQAFASAPGLERISETMLMDLAQGMDMLARLKSHPS